MPIPFENKVKTRLYTIEKSQLDDYIPQYLFERQP